MNTVKKFVASLHTHVESLFDAWIDADKLCKTIQEWGGTACAVTDHGVLTAIEDFRRVFETYKLKFIPGCELYVDGGVLGRLHLVVLAKDYQGYLGISKIVTVSNYTLDEKNFPVISQETLLSMVKEYQGHIIGLSACMQGVLSSIYLMNPLIEAKIERAEKKRDEYINPYGDIMKGKETEIANLEKEVMKLSLEKDNLTIVAEQKFTQRRKAIAKAETFGQDVTDAKLELEKDQAEAAQAKEKLPKVKAELKALTSKVSQANKEYNAMIDEANKWLTKDEEVKALKLERKTKQEIEALAEKVAGLYRESFGTDNFYAELQYHGIEEEKICFRKVLELAKRIGMPIVATNDVHMLTNTKNDRLARRLLRSLRFGKRFEDESDADRELYLKDNYEMLKALTQIIPEEDAITAINNIEEITNSCDVVWPKEEHYPVFSKTEDTEKIFDEAIEDGVKWRFPNGLSPEYRERLEYEKGVIKKMGYVDYHLIVKDFLEYGRLLGYVPTELLDKAPLNIPQLKAWIDESGWTNPGMTIGNGRGSAAGSLVCYCLGITSLDPIKYGLLFERFLNVERISMPDIDSDFANAIRGKVIDYVKVQYGEKAVCGIMTKQYQAPKKAIATAAKFYALSQNRNDGVGIRNIINANVPDDPKTSFSIKVNNGGAIDANGEMTLYEYLLNQFGDNKDYLEVIRWAKVIEGSFTAYSSHAAGVVISDNDDVSDYIPLRYNVSSGEITTQCDMAQLEEGGLLKFDFLGLKTLDIITESMRLIKKNHGIQVDPFTLNIFDENIYKMLSVGRTKGVFQFESPGMTDTIKKMKPTCFEDLIIIVSMYRPGPMQFIDDVVAVKNGTKEAEYLCPELKPILGKTYGAIVYQEQVMEIFQKLAGYTLGGADMVRRYMSKKKADKLAHEREAFINGDSERNIAGCVANGIDANAANKLFDQMMDFASYAFNKSHAACYAFNSYITAWLKYYYPAEFLTACLNQADKPAKISALMHETQNLNINIKAPDINESEKNFSCKDGSIYFGLSSVSGIGNSAQSIIDERANGHFRSLGDFLLRNKPKANVLKNLIASGACDAFNSNRAAMQQYAEEIGPTLDIIFKKRSFIASAEFVLPKVESFTDNEALKEYQLSNGYKAEIKECTTAEKLSKRIENAKSSLKDAETILADSKIQYVKESALERMNEERNLLGVYVTASPMDSYPSPNEVYSTAVSDVTLANTSVYGVVTNLKIRHRKKDGASMAFFTLEDATGSIEISMFAKAYAKYEKVLKEGHVYVFLGKAELDTFGDGTDDEEEKLKFIVEDIRPVSEKRKAILLSVSSYPVFHCYAEDLFIQKYKDDKGREFIIYEELTGHMRKMTYRVKENLLGFSKAREVAI